MTDKNGILNTIRAVTELTAPPLVPELELWLVTVRSPWWALAPDDLESQGIPEPFWAFAWGGGQCLARYILDNPAIVCDQNVIDFGAGGGIVTLAALKSGAQHVTATEIDPWAIEACQLNLKGEDARVSLSCEDWVGRALPAGTVLLCGDMNYEKDLTDRMVHWFSELKDCTILIGDPGRGFIDAAVFEVLADYWVPTDSDADGRYKVRGFVQRYVGRSERS